jgi:hypothetical protein
MTKNIIKLKESQLNKIVQRVILEQTKNDEIITISGALGDTNDKFAGLKVFVKKVINTVNEKLKEKPYIIRLIRKDSTVGISTENGKSDNDFFMKINFVPVQEEKRYSFFTCAAAIYSEASDFQILSAEVNSVLLEKRANWPSGQKYSLGMDLFDLKDFAGLDANDLTKTYKLLFKYSAGTNPPLDPDLPIQQ